MIELTDSLITQGFEKAGVDNRYYSVYDTEVRRLYASLQEDNPDDEDSEGYDNNALSSVEIVGDYIKYYAKELDKGHCSTWANAYARSFNTWGDAEDAIRDAVDSLQNEDERTAELEIHANSISHDPVFKARYKQLIKEYVSNAENKASEYAKAYHRCIDEGKSEDYAKAYANACNDYSSGMDIYADAYDVAKRNGANAIEAEIFAFFCIEASDYGPLMSINDFSERFKEEWQRDYYLQWICKDYADTEKKQMPNDMLEELKQILHK